LGKLFTGNHRFSHEDRAIAQVVNSGATAMEKGRGDLKQSIIQKAIENDHL
jgi:hypothetical protein